MLHRDSPPKRATNLSLNAKVLDSARELGLNLSQTVDRLLAEEVRRLQAEAWLERNRAAIDAYNTRVEKAGMWNQSLRKDRGSI
jgi:antitoxin CcdA